MSCPAIVRGCALRITKNDACDVPLTTGSKYRLAMAAFTELTIEPDVDEGDEIYIKNACGTVCVYDPACPTIKGYNVTIKLCGWQTYVLEMLLGAGILTTTVGAVTTVNGQVAPNRNFSTCLTSFAIEVWGKNANPSGACSTVANPQTYVQFLLPKVRNWSIDGQVTFSNGATELSLKGYAEQNPNFAAPIAAEWTATEIAAIKAGGPWAWKFVSALPTLAECSYAA